MVQHSKVNGLIATFAAAAIAIGAGCKSKPRDTSLELERKVADIVSAVKIHGTTDDYALRLPALKVGGLVLSYSDGGNDYNRILYMETPEGYTFGDVAANRWGVLSRDMSAEASIDKNLLPKYPIYVDRVWNELKKKGLLQR